MTRTDPPTHGSGGTVGTGSTGVRRRQPRPRWPEGARCAVALTFTLDAELFWLRLHPSARHRPKTLGLCWIPALDPQSIGKPGRALLLEELLDHIRGHDDVWFATGAQVAEHWRRTASPGPGSEPDAHPQRVRATWHSSPPPPTGP
ncbi:MULTISPECIES: hypothetical protein [Streptomyces]|uniref:Uncharacterized protein n=1 Tax=Streptomyces melanosporofaciens TaxID=67327 RepID=A0A1H4VXD3_STRMJ|nr:hypothetical protein [Streptomyces melanosporofaciens]SEC85643.1 hypothetical protein SAMN04490356_5810 [Streptomyces melanosporofaciens]